MPIKRPMPRTKKNIGDHAQVSGKTSCDEIGNDVAVKEWQESAPNREDK
jgi:hypothetical protein